MRPIVAKIARGLSDIAEAVNAGKAQLESTSQNIGYCMANTGQFVSSTQHNHIELDEAVSRTCNLDWTYRKNGISFINNKTGDSLFLCRMDYDKWYADTPIRLPRYDGLVWISVVDQITMERLLGLFFAGSDWFSSTSWFDSPVPFEMVSSKGMYGMY